MYYMQVAPKTAVIQLSKAQNQTINTTAKQESRAEAKKPPKPKFRSIFTLPWGSSEQVSLPIQAMKKVNPQYNASKTIQLQGSSLRKDKFNVVGEDHKESDERRDEEEKYAETYSGSSNYWIEPELPERPLTDDEKRQQKEEPSFRDPRKFADPYKLHYFYGARMLQEDAHKLTGLANTAKERKDFNRLRLLFINNQHFIDLLKDDRRTKVLNIFSNELSKAEKKGFRGLLKQIKYIARTFKDVYETVYKLAVDAGYTDFTKPTELDLDWASEGLSEAAVTTENNDTRSLKIILEANLKKFTESVDDLVDTITYKKQLIEDKHWQSSSEELSEERSRSMHQAATRFEDSQEKGVWKIGDLHVEDIKRLFPPHKINYNLVTMEDFNEHFDEYLQMMKRINRSYTLRMAFYR